MQRIIVKGGRLDERRNGAGNIYPELLITGENVEVFNQSEIGAEPVQIGVEGNWRIWSIQHGAWWKPKHNGYTNLFEEAGLYPYAEALKIVQGANINLSSDELPNEAMIQA